MPPVCSPAPGRALIESHLSEQASCGGGAAPVSRRGPAVGCWRRHAGARCGFRVGTETDRAFDLGRVTHEVYRPREDVAAFAPTAPIRAVTIKDPSLT